MFWFRHSCVTNRPCIFLRYSVSVTYTPPFMCALKDKIKDGDTIIQGQITQADYTIYFKKKKKKGQLIAFEIILHMNCLPA